MHKSIERNCQDEKRDQMKNIGLNVKFRPIYDCINTHINHMKKNCNVKIAYYYINYIIIMYIKLNICNIYIDLFRSNNGIRNKKYSAMRHMRQNRKAVRKCLLFFF